MIQLARTSLNGTHAPITEIVQPTIATSSWELACPHALFMKTKATIQTTATAP